MGSGSPRRLLSLPVELGEAERAPCVTCSSCCFHLSSSVPCVTNRVTKPQTGTWDGPSQPGFAESEQMGAEAEGLRGKRAEQM